ncbi:hypothetical protein P3S67_010539 [Capsicum chacoense]
MLVIPGYDLQLQYYMKTGMCKFGAFCKYHHPRQREGYPSLGNLFLCQRLFPHHPLIQHCILLLFIQPNNMEWLLATS